MAADPSTSSQNGDRLAVMLFVRAAGPNDVLGALDAVSEVWGYRTDRLLAPAALTAGETVQLGSLGEAPRCRDIIAGQVSVKSSWRGPRTLTQQGRLVFAAVHCDI